MKQERHQAIRRIITENEIDTQEALLAKLREEGYHVTQATVSRDMRELMLFKTATATGYKYVAPDEKSAGNIASHFTHALAESVISVDCAQNLIVVKTYSGMAGAVATCIDSIRSPDIIGCVAGDDAILVVARDLEKTQELCARMKEDLRQA